MASAMLAKISYRFVEENSDVLFQRNEIPVDAVRIFLEAHKAGIKKANYHPQSFILTAQNFV